MQATKIINIVLIVVVLIAVAWGISLIRPPQPAGQTQTQGQHVLAGTVTPAGNYHYAEAGDYYTIEAAYPATTTLSGSADAKARMTIEQAIADRAAQFKKDGNFANLTAQDVQVQGLGPDRKYAFGMDYQEYASASFDSFLYVVYEDTLGAHPNAYFATFVFNKNGDTVALSDLFKTGSDYLARIAATAKTQATAQLTSRLGADAAASIFADGLAPTAANYQNFVIAGDTLHIFFPPYQVAAYAAGAFDISIPLASLADILAPGVR